MVPFPGTARLFLQSRKKRKSVFTAFSFLFLLPIFFCNAKRPPKAAFSQVKIPQKSRSHFRLRLKIHNNPGFIRTRGRRNSSFRFSDHVFSFCHSIASSHLPPFHRVPASSISFSQDTSCSLFCQVFSYALI